MLYAFLNVLLTVWIVGVPVSAIAWGRAPWKLKDEDFLWPGVVIAWARSKW